MPPIRTLALLLGLSSLAGCRPRAVAGAAESRAERTVFTDSAMHVSLCQPTKPGEDWRRVCTPLDQSATPVKRLP